MKKIVKLFGFIISVVTLFCCSNGNYKNIQINGIVYDKDSKHPINNGIVKVRCWAYNLEKWESEATEKEVKTDSQGKFSVSFKEGEALDITASAYMHKEFNASKNLNKNFISIKIALENL